jgi:4-hydroxy-3-methylbut-2-enyl diphosphate reductase IspH
MRTGKETVEYSTGFLAEWNQFCESKGYVKRQASAACRLAIMEQTAEQREQFMDVVSALMEREPPESLQK